MATYRSSLPPCVTRLPQLASTVHNIESLLHCSEHNIYACVVSKVPSPSSLWSYSLYISMEQGHGTKPVNIHNKAQFLITKSYVHHEVVITQGLWLWSFLPQPLVDPTCCFLLLQLYRLPWLHVSPLLQSLFLPLYGKIIQIIVKDELQYMCTLKCSLMHGCFGLWFSR